MGSIGAPKSSFHFNGVNWGPNARKQALSWGSNVPKWALEEMQYELIIMGGTEDAPNSEAGPCARRGMHQHGINGSASCIIEPKIVLGHPTVNHVV